MISLLLALSLAQTGQTYAVEPAQPDNYTSRPRQYRSGGPPRTSRLGQSQLVALCDALTADDKSGAWECMRGDGTMASGSATTFVATGAPTNSTEGGWPVRTYTAAQNDQQPSNAAFPASSFSVCYHRRSTALPNVQIAAFGTSGSGAGFSALPFEQQTNGNIISYVSNGVLGGPFTSVTGLTAGAWNLLCLTYTRTGGAADNVGVLYKNGVAINSSSTMNLAQALSSVWSTNGYAAASGGSAGSTRGFFVTYKALSAADIARIYARLGP